MGHVTFEAEGPKVGKRGGVSSIPCTPPQSPHHRRSDSDEQKPPSSCWSPTEMISSEVEAEGVRGQYLRKVLILWEDAAVVRADLYMTNSKNIRLISSFTTFGFNGTSAQ